MGKRTGETGKRAVISGGRKKTETPGEKKKSGIGRYLPDRRQVLAVLAGILLAIFSYAGSRGDISLPGGYLLERPEPGQEERTEQLIVSSPEDEARIPVQISARQYTEKEAAGEMDRLADRMGEALLGENTSPEEIRSPLVFSATGTESITAEWRPDEETLIGADGSVEGDLVPEEGIKTGVRLFLRTETQMREYRFPLTLYPPVLDEKTAFWKGLEKDIRESNREQAEEDYLHLPEQYGGKTIQYHREASGEWMIFPLLGAGAAALMPLLDRQREKEKKKEREVQMMRDYPEIISRLVVYTGAGLPVRKAWERIVTEYEKTGGGHAAYDEMAKAHHMMQRGVPELQAYESFAAGCRSLPYRKMAGLLAQNIRNGSEKMREALELEMENAFEQRKNLARRQGEQASTKLLIPLLLMLMIVMVMVSVPAFLAFGL
ncbi:MAG: type II secretion system F family protein [Clostridium sp.]|nr:type II secretion system F family protein [Clostridium sp.]MBO6150304.1 type II secretion system F family protein [Clostridium sp.]